MLLGSKVENKKTLLSDKQSEASSKKSVVGTCIEYGCLLFFVCLIYKFVVLGAITLGGIVCLGFLARGSVVFVFSTTSLFGIFYVALATITAFQVDLHEGAYRSTQFALIFFSSLVVARHFAQISPERAEVFLRKLFWLTLIIFVHAVVYHLMIERYFSWKMLYDTKLTFSLLPVLFFAREDSFKKSLGQFGWLVVLGILAVLILMSGERKAYVLLAALFFFSNTSNAGKVFLFMLAGVALTIYTAMADDGGYIVRQITSLFQGQKERTMTEFYALNDIGNRSDVIRDFVNHHARQLFLENPFFGVGATGYQQWALAKFGSFQGGFAMNVHGEINRVPVENGLFGIIVVLTYMIGCARGIWSYLRHKGCLTISFHNKLPLYVFLFMLPFLATEACNIAMCELILLFGFYVAIITRKRKQDLFRYIRKTRVSH